MLWSIESERHLSSVCLGQEVYTCSSFMTLHLYQTIKTCRHCYRHHERYQKEGVYVQQRSNTNLSNGELDIHNFGRPQRELSTKLRTCRNQDVAKGYCAKVFRSDQDS